MAFAVFKTDQTGSSWFKWKVSLAILNDLEVFRTMSHHADNVPYEGNARMDIWRLLLVWSGTKQRCRGNKQKGNADKNSTRQAETGDARIEHCQVSSEISIKSQRLRSVLKHCPPTIRLLSRQKIGQEVVIANIVSCWTRPQGVLTETPLPY